MSFPAIRERRKAPRSAIDLPVALIIHDCVYPGRTLDISNDGVAVVVRHAISISCENEIELVLTLVHFGAQSRTRLRVIAAVTRLEGFADRQLVAVRARYLWTRPPTLGLHRWAYSS